MLLDENSDYFFHRDWFDLEVNVLPKHLIIHQEFKKMLSFHADQTYANQFFEVIRYTGMGLGLMNKHWMPWTELASEVRGYLEFITEDLFDGLHALGHNSLFSYQDERNERLFCILYGPLLVTAILVRMLIGILDSTYAMRILGNFISRTFSMKFARIVSTGRENPIKWKLKKLYLSLLRIRSLLLSVHLFWDEECYCGQLHSSYC